MLEGSGTGLLDFVPLRVVSGPVPNENSTFEIVVVLLTPVRLRVKVAGPSVSGLWTSKLALPLG
jgi:hypothetical protein